MDNDFIKIAVVGSRTFNNYNFLCEILNKYKENIFLIVSGGAKGADSLGEKWANENNIKTLIIRPDWEKHGRAAGFIRNKDIVDESDIVIAFWNQTSKGTKNTIDYAIKQNKLGELHFFKENDE
ncbi:MAG: DUF2493 domain-containing protein [bacterium]